MKKIIISSVLFMLFYSSNSIYAKCFTFKKADGIKVCLNGNSNADRKKASDVCKSVNGSDCGGISGYSGSCQKSNSTKCIDEAGAEQKSLKVD